MEVPKEPPPADGNVSVLKLEEVKQKAMTAQLEDNGLTKVLIDTGANVSIFQDAKLGMKGTLRSAKAKIATADKGHFLELRCSGGIELDFGGSRRYTREGVYFSQNSTTNLMGLKDLQRLGISAIFHEGTTRLVDATSLERIDLQKLHVLVDEEYEDGLPYIRLDIRNSSMENHIPH